VSAVVADRSFACEGCGQSFPGYQESAGWWGGPYHCANCHATGTDAGHWSPGHRTRGHRACAYCGNCLPDGHAVTRFYCGPRCRMGAFQQRQAVTVNGHRGAERGVTDNASLASARTVTSNTPDKLPASLAVTTCPECGLPLAAGAPVWRVSGGYRKPPIMVCEACWSSTTTYHSDFSGEDREVPAYYLFGDEHDSRYPDARSCEGCGRPIHGWWREDQHAICSDACALAVVRARRAEGRAMRPCEGCGESFRPARADGQYCQPACRQRAYRDRKREAVHA
jgi:hypothetical protein